MRKFWTVAASIAVSTGAFAQVLGGIAPQFVEKPGAMEFSGQMIARPRQLSAWAKLNVPLSQAQARRAEARRLVIGQTVRYVPETDEYIIAVLKGTENANSMNLMASGDFEYVEPDWTVYPIAIPNDPSYASQWHLAKIGLPDAWNYFTGGSPVIVAITDTGVRTDHQDLASQLVSGANSASGTAIPQTSGGAVEDINGHGSHCAGIAGAAGNNGVGVSGVNWNVKIMPVRVTNSTGGSSSISALTAGARWAADNGARVVSTSYSGVDSASVGTTGTYIKNTRNGIYCWAAGNDNLQRTVDHVDVTIVGASDSNDLKASFSAFGPAIDVFAPGVNILSTYNASSTSYATLSGTSMATPCTAGLAALITGTNPALSAQEVEDILYQTCFDLTAAPGGVGNDSYWGWGRIDASAAIRRSYNTKPFAASSFAKLNGALISGGVPELGNSDNQYLNLGYARPVGGTLIGAEFTATTTNLQPGRIDFIFEVKASVDAVAQEIYLFNFTTNAWTLVDFRRLDLTETTNTITPVNSTQYRQPGTGLMKARVFYSAKETPGMKTLQVSIDRAAWTTAP